MKLADATREDVEGYLGAVLARWKPATAHNHYRALWVFYAWLEDECGLATRTLTWSGSGSATEVV